MTSHHTPEELAKLAERLVGTARIARRLLQEGDAAALHKLQLELRDEADEATGVALLLLEVAETFMRALCRSDLGRMDRAIHLFAASHPTEADRLFAMLLDRGRISQAELEALPGPAGASATNLIEVGCLRKLEGGALDLRPSLRGLARDLISPAMFRHWREVDEMRGRVARLDDDQVAAVAMASGLGVTEREARRHLAAFPLRPQRVHHPAQGRLQSEQDKTPGPVTTVAEPVPTAIGPATADQRRAPAPAPVAVSAN